mmetsp:Transcript_11373/g.25320  ORF Transcript_11373/g.25320 Transcript_11373/m.25320 type:complete len:211 (-) Transcript_11373:42-674(-)
MLYGIFRHTTNLGPAVALDGILVVGGSSLEQRLIRSAASSNNTNLGTHIRGHSFLSATWHAQTGGSLIFVMSHHNSVGSRSAGNSTTISLSGLDVADNSSLWHGRKRQDIANGQGSLLTAVNELTFVHSFGANHQLIVALETVRVTELDLGNGSTTARVVQNFFNDATNVTMLFGIVQSSKLHGTLASPCVSLENRALTATLCLDVFTHG